MRDGTGTVFLNGSALIGGSWDSGLKVFTIPYSGLTYSTAYEIRITSFKDFWGDVMEDNESHGFITQAPPVILPAVTTNPAVSAITSSGAETDGSVTSDGGGIVTERGFVYSIAADPRIGEPGVTKVMTGQGTGDYTAILSGLIPDTLYYVAAYAINSKGTGYGLDVTFTSLAEPDFMSRTLTDSATGISVSGTIHKVAVLLVEDLTLGNDPACRTIRQYMKDDGYLFLLGRDIQVIEGYVGPLTVTIPVATRYEGQTVTVLHCADGVLKTYSATVRNGKIEFQVITLSPFAVFMQLSTVPETGEGSSTWMGWLFICVSAMAFAAALILYLRRKFTEY